MKYFFKFFMRERAVSLPGIGTVLFFFLFLPFPAHAQKAGKLKKLFRLSFRGVNAYTGVCIFNPANGKYLYQVNGDHYFTPASNTKIYSLYTALNYLGDSTSGIKYKIADDTLYIQGTGDPSLLHPDYPVQPVMNFLQQSTYPIVFTHPVDENEVFGPGWSWNDYSEDYQPERSTLPLYGNVIWCTVQDDQLQTLPAYFQKTGALVADRFLRTSRFRVLREQNENIFRYAVRTGNDDNVIQVPFKVEEGKVSAALLADTLHRPVRYDATPVSWDDAGQIRNIPVDSLYQHMMYRSDNFFAEELLQMCSDKLFDTISTARIIQFMLGNKLQDLPDKPRWVDGSGLSRFNLFTPRDMTYLLNKLYNEYPKERLYNIFPTGGKGTLKNLYHEAENYIFAKTGSLSNCYALSGYLITKKGKTLIFSILVNNSVSPGNQVRKAMERFLLNIRNRY